MYIVQYSQYIASIGLSIHVRSSVYYLRGVSILHIAQYIDSMGLSILHIAQYIDSTGLSILHIAQYIDSTGLSILHIHVAQYIDPGGSKSHAVNKSKRLFSLVTRTLA